MIVVAGEALVDLVIQPDGSVTAALGGAPYNAARAAARLGAEVEFAGALSDDRFGTMLVAQLEADGVGLAYAPRSELPTTLAAAELDGSGAATYRFYIDGTSAPELTAGHALPDHLDVYFTGGLGLVLEPMAHTIERDLAQLPPTTLVVVDANCRPRVIRDRDRYVALLRRVLARCDLAKVSDEDLAYLAPGVDPIEAARGLLEHGTAAIIVTAGAEHTTVVTADGARTIGIPPIEVPVVDTIGAGDTFVGALLAWWAAAGCGRDDARREDAGDRLARAVEAAHAAAAVVVTRRGADPPWRADLPADWHR